MLPQLKIKKHGLLWELSVFLALFCVKETTFWGPESFLIENHLWMTVCLCIFCSLSCSSLTPSAITWQWCGIHHGEWLIQWWSVPVSQFREYLSQLWRQSWWECSPSPCSSTSCSPPGLALPVSLILALIRTSRYQLPLCPSLTLQVERLNSQSSLTKAFREGIVWWLNWKRVWSSSEGLDISSEIRVQDR